MIQSSMKQIQSKLHNCFVYGTLMSPEVLQTLLGRVPNNISPAFLPPSYSRHPVIGQVYPGVISSGSDSILSKLTTVELEEKCVKGMILMDLDEVEMKIFDWFEDIDYDRQMLPIYAFGRQGDTIIVNANVYVWIAGTSKLDLTRSWNYQNFQETKLDWYLQATVYPCRKNIEDLGICSK